MTVDMGINNYANELTSLIGQPVRRLEYLVKETLEPWGIAFERTQLSSNTEGLVTGALTKEGLPVASVAFYIDSSFNVKRVDTQLLEKPLEG